MLKRLIGLAFTAVLLTGCAANSYCLDKQDYADSKGVPPLANADSLKVPVSATALRIPPAALDPVPFGEKVTNAEGKERASCLDMPPAMPPMAPGPEPASEPPVAPAPAEGTKG